MKFRPEIDYYEVLQVHPRASPDMVKRAYRALMGEMGGHPDLGGDEERAKLINEAYSVLGDPDLRRAYDQTRRGGANAGAGGFPDPAGGLVELTGLARKVVLSIVVVAAALALARVLRSPTLDLADLLAMIVLLLRIWSQVSVPGRA